MITEQRVDHSPIADIGLLSSHNLHACWHRCTYVCVLSAIALACTFTLISPAWNDDAGAAAVATTSAPAVGTPQLVYGDDFPDASIFDVNGTYYAYSTNIGGENMPVMSSTDLLHWKSIGDALAILPTWAENSSGFTWAPTVTSAPGGGYEAFFSTLDANGRECIGRATAPAPIGPFLDTSSGPLVCSNQHGAIDPSLYHSSSGDILVWKADTGRGQAAQILAQSLAAGDTALVGAPTVLLTADLGWEDGIVEGPELAEVGGELDLFFSANRWDTSDYAVGVTSCSSPLGPCDQAGAHVVVSSQPGVTGPGGPDIVIAQGHEYLAFSAWTGGPIGSGGARRALYISRLDSTGTAIDATSNAGLRATTQRGKSSP